jgi:hypothetical protein
MKIEPEVDYYRTLRVSSTGIVYVHCRNCFGDKPEEVSFSEWMDLEGIIDLQTGVLTIGCKRCKLPIVSAMMPSDVVEHIADCGCELCQPK